MTTDKEATPTQKGAEVAWLLANGKEFTTAEIAERYSMTWHGANKLLNSVSGKLPITKDDKSRWKRM